MGWEGLFVIGLVVLVFIMLAVSSIAPDLILMGALVLLMLTGVLLPEQAFAGFANTGLMTIAALYIVAAGLRETGAIQYVTRRLLGEPDTVRSAQFRMLMPTAVLSAFLNNTTIVAMLIPAVQEWCQRLRMSPAKLLLPLSYIAILGGTCTLIGTSTNLVVNGLLQKSGHAGLGMFDITGIGLMLLVSGSIFLLLFGNRLLSNRSSVSEDFEKVREYHVDMIVTDVLDGKSLSVAGLANLGFGYLAELERNGEIIQSPEHDFVLQVGDQLSFIGSPRCAQELRSIQGLQPANTQFQQMTVVHFRRRLVEAVIGGDFPFLGKTIRECDFLGNYQAVVLSVSRGGQNPLQDKGLNSRLQVGDTLLLEAGKEFANQYRFRRDFMLVSALENSSPPNFQKARIALLIMGVMVALSTFNILPILQSAWLAAGVMLVTGCMNAGLARRSIDYTVLTVIGASFALGAAMESSGAAEFIAQQLMSMGHLSVMSALAAVYLLTTLFTNIITNNAAAILMFPICEVLAKQMGVDVVPFALTIMFAASASFMTPIGYQTNLMVYGPGGYRFTDYLRLGVPMNVIAGVVTLLGIQWLWL
ncbi:MAG: SLC13 family permease [Proteobacteria bacterium]|nr:MAG: SLC13 family permease [Pseudomonadota bacterium]